MAAIEQHKGITRRASASSAHIPPSASTSTTRVHRSNESHHGFVGVHPTHAGLTFGPANASGSPQDKVVLALIKRLTSKLPCYSGLSLTDIESDDAVLLIIESLVELARHALDIIVWKLLEELEKLARQNDTGSHRTLDLLQSEVFLLKVLSVTLAYRWQHRRTSTKTSQSHLDGATPQNGHARNGGSNSPVPSPSASIHPRGAAMHKKPRPGSRSTDRLPNSSGGLWLDAPPLDENCALWLVSVMTLLLRQAAPRDDRTRAYASLSPDATLFGFETVDRDPGWEGAAAVPASWIPGAADGQGQDGIAPSGAGVPPPRMPRKTPSLTSMSSNATAPIPLPRSALGFQPTARTLITSSLPLHNLIGLWAGHIVYLLSAVNWVVVMNRIKTKIHSLARANPSEENLDASDLVLLHHCAMDRKRLIQVLSELSSLLVNMKRDAQAAVAVSLRRAIWNWVETFPTEFFEVIKGERKLEGAAERVFDLFFQSCDDTNKKALWPTLSVLMLLSHDRSKQLVLAYANDRMPKSNKKELLFVDQLHKNMVPTSKWTDISLLCGVDMCRAACRVPPMNELTQFAFANETADDVKGRLWKAANQRPFFESAEPIDVSLYADALVALFRFLPKEESLQLFSSCLEPERSEAVKMCAVKACIILQQESERWPWLESPNNGLWGHIGPRIRRILRSAASRRNELDQNGNMKRPAAKPTAKRYASETIADREMLILAILALYRIDPRCFLFEGDAKEMDGWVTDTVQLIQRPGDPAVPLSALRTIIHAAHWVNALSSGDLYYEQGRAWLAVAIPAVLLASSTRLLDARDDFEEQRICIEMAYGIVLLYSKFAESELASNWDIVSGRLPAMAVAEIAFLVSLTSADNAVSKIAAKALREIALAEGSPSARQAYEISDERAKRFTMYEQLGDPSVMTVGRVGHQRRVRKLLRMLSVASPICIAVWQECYWRWSALKESVARRSVDLSAGEGQNGYKPIGDRTMSAEERMYQWQNLTLFLAAFGAASTLDQHNGKEILTIIPAKYLPDRFRAAQDGEQMIQNFIVASVDFLIAESPHAREVVKEALGSELSARLYPRLFRQLNIVVDDITKTANEIEGDSHGREEEFLLVFFEQFLAVLKLLVDRADSASEDVLGNVELNQTLLSLTKFMDRFNELSYLRVRVKFCNFCETALARTDVFGLRKDDVVRNNLLDVVSEWIEPELLVPDDYDGSMARMQQMQHDANMACIRTVVKLLERLRLQPLDGATGDDAAHVVSRRFNRYQTLLLQALRISQSEDNDEDILLQPPNYKSALEKDAEMRDLVITGLAHLLSANTDIGLKHFLPLGYAGDSHIRAIFCHVIARVMDQGAKFETSNESASAGRRTRIGELVKGSDMTLVLVICETCPVSEVDAVLPVLLNLFDTRSSLLALLKLLIEREVKTATSEAALFRGNSMRMRLLCAFAKLHGYDYLRQLVKPLLEKMCVLTAQHTFVLETSKATEEEVLDNQETVKFFTQAFLDIVCNSASGMPLMIREICNHISQTVSEVWPEAKFAALGAFIFLRFISPALVSPRTIDVELPPEHIGLPRGLLHIGKIIQNLANNVRFGKEAHMVPFNDFLAENIVRVMRFLTDVHKYASAAVEEEPDEWFGGTFDETDAIVLHRFFEKHADKVGRELLSLSKSSKEGDAAVVGGKKAWDTLCAALVDMGHPVEPPQLSMKTTADSEDYREFMMRNSDRNTDSVRELFQGLTVTKDHSALFLLTIWRLDVEILDFELLVYHIFTLLTTPEYEGRKFEVVMDCTNYTSASEIPMQWLKFFLELIPRDLRERFGTAHLLNCNLPMHKYLRKVYNICTGVFVGVNIQTYFSIQDLCDALHDDLTSLLSHAWSLEQEPKEVFKDVMLRQAHLMKVPVQLAVAQSHLRIYSIKAQDIYPNFSSRSTEYIPYSDVGDIYNVSTGRDANEFIIRRSRNGGTLYFSSAEREHIVKAIRFAKSRMSDGRTVFFDRFSRLSNISAALLNIGMFNTFGESADLRHAAYNLLSAVCNSLNYSGDSFLPSMGGFIPGNPITYITQLSEKLAAFAPQLTLDFISQVCVELDKSTVHQKAIRLQYMNPWIKNLSKFCNPTNKLYELSGARLRDCIRLLIDLTFRDAEVYYIMQKYTWAEVGKLDSVVLNVVLDEIMRAAVDGGMGSSRCEMMADTLSSMCSISARGRILSKLRKTLGKTSMKPSKSLEKNVHWNEITAYTRLAYGSGTVSHKFVQNELFVPEVIHLITLLAAQGETSVRMTIYGLTLQLFQTLYRIHSNDTGLASEIHGLLQELRMPETMRLFGLGLMTTTTSEYTALDISNDLVALEGLSKWLLKAVSISAGSVGLANVWRSRWMSLLTATAFQLSHCIQPRAFVVLGTLASSDVDDDLLYQMLVALKSAMRTADESDTLCIVSMLHCICKVVPVLPHNSRYLGPLFWLAVALLQSSHAAFYKEANSLLCACLHAMHAQGGLREKCFTGTLLDARAALEDISLQLDQILGISFESDFSFSLAAVIFKGMRRSQLRVSATEALRCLLKTSVATSEPVEAIRQGEATVLPDALGYFLALLAVSTTPQAYRQLLEDTGVGTSWLVTKDSPSRADDEEDQVPRVPFDVLGITDANTALLAISFVGTLLSTAQGDDAESQILFSLLSDASYTYPETVSLLYEGLQEKIHDTFANSSNPAILASVSTVFRIAMEDATRSVALRGSSSTLSTVDEEAAYAPGRRHILALEEMGMQGLANTFQFLPPSGGHVTTVLNWFPELITKIIE